MKATAYRYRELTGATHYARRAIARHLHKVGRPLVVKAYHTGASTA